MAKPQYLRCGEIINTHGLRGAVKVRAECDSPKILASLRHIYLDPNGDVVFEIVSSSVMGNFVLLSLSGINTLDAAATLKNKIIYAGRDELEEHIAPGAHFIADLWTSAYSRRYRRSWHFKGCIQCRCVGYLCCRYTAR